MSDNSLDRILEELDEDNYNVSDEESSLEDKMIPKDYLSEDDTTDDEPIQFRRVRKWGRYPPSKTAACDQHPIGVTRGDKTWEFIGR